MAPNPVADGIGRGFNDSTDQKYSPGELSTDEHLSEGDGVF
jgi:hypothetical protein